MLVAPDGATWRRISPPVRGWGVSTAQAARAATRGARKRSERKEVFIGLVHLGARTDARKPPSSSRNGAGDATQPLRHLRPARRAGRP